MRNEKAGDRPPLYGCDDYSRTDRHIFSNLSSMGGTCKTVYWEDTLDEQRYPWRISLMEETLLYMITLHTLDSIWR